MGNEHFVIIHLSSGEAFLAHTTRDGDEAEAKADALRAQVAGAHGIWHEDRYISSDRVEEVTVATIAGQHE